jgi:hypothetical protein
MMQLQFCQLFDPQKLGLVSGRPQRTVSFLPFSSSRLGNREVGDAKYLFKNRLVCVVALYL